MSQGKLRKKARMSQDHSNNRFTIPRWVSAFTDTLFNSGFRILTLVHLAPPLTPPASALQCRELMADWARSAPAVSRGWPQLGKFGLCDSASACQGRLLPDSAALLSLRHDQRSIAGDLVDRRGPLLLHQLRDHEQFGRRCCQLGALLLLDDRASWRTNEIETCSERALSEKLCWRCLRCGMRCVAVGKEKVLQSSMDRQIGIAGLFGWLESLDNPFKKAICGGVVWCHMEMLDAVALQEVPELFSGELWFIVAHKLLRNSMICEQHKEMLNGLFGGGRTHLHDFGPLAVGVNYDELHARQEGSSKVDVDPLPWASRPFPWMQQGFGRLVVMLLAVTARGDTGLDVVVNLRPPNIAVSELLRAHDTAVRTVKLDQDIPWQAGWNDYGCTPQKTSLMWNELGAYASMVVWLVVSASSMRGSGYWSTLSCGLTVTLKFSTDADWTVLLRY